LAYLKYLPVNLLNIDKTFIDNVPYSKKDSAIISSIIAMAHHLGYKVLAEGVETNKQLAFLQQHGCDEYQGCLYSPAVTAEELVKMLQNNKH
jgi:sensor c-di-GMP phosphodiesterase-like protein